MHTTKQLAKARTLATKLAASADPARNDNEAERTVALAKLIALCTKYGFNVAEFVKPVAGEAEQPKAESTTTANDPKANDTEAQSNRDAEAERAAANRATTQRHYAGPSQASHATRAPKLTEALARVAVPIQRAKSASARDESALALALKHSDEANTFCPVAGTFDLGVLSRLASLGMLAVAGDRIKLTDTGLALARNVAKRAA